MFELVSKKHLLTKPRYAYGAWLSTRLNWARDESVALKTLCEAGADLNKAADGLGRSPTSIAHRASDTGLKLPYEWRDAITTYKRKPRKPREELLQYPFIREVRGEHETLLAVNELVPKRLPSHMRADVCQEIMLAIYAGDYSVEEFQSEPLLIRKFINKFRQHNCEMGGFALSLDVPLRDGRSWYDVLPEPETESVYSLEDLAEAFPGIARSGNGQWEKQKARDRRARENIAYLERLRETG